MRLIDLDTLDEMADLEIELSELWVSLTYNEKIKHVHDNIGLVRMFRTDSKELTNELLYRFVATVTIDQKQHNTDNKDENHDTAIATGTSIIDMGTATGTSTIDMGTVASAVIATGTSTTDTGTAASTAVPCTTTTTNAGSSSDTSKSMRKIYDIQPVQVSSNTLGALYDEYSDALIDQIFRAGRRDLMKLLVRAINLERNWVLSVLPYDWRIKIPKDHTIYRGIKYLNTIY